ncbi:condensation domain-containing protein, partial [Streptomyces sp. NPDC055078]
RVDAAGLGPDALRSAVAEHAHRARAALDPDAGVVVRAVWFDAGPEPGRLLLMAHHLVVDGVSWRVLLPDLAAAWESVSAGRPVALAPVETSFARWSRLLTELALDPVREAELPLWTAVLDGDGGTEPFPLAGAPDPARDTTGTARELALRLEPAHTGPLLSSVPAAFGASVNDVLLAGLALAVADWRRRHEGPGAAADAATSDAPDTASTVDTTAIPETPATPETPETPEISATSATSVLVDLEGHGREEELAGDSADLSRTVGWFTSVFPVRLDPGPVDLADAFAGGPAAAEAVERVRTQLAALPANGVGYGLLRYLNPRTRAVLARRQAPRIEFNYLGRFDVPEAADWSYAPEEDAADIGAEAAMREGHALSINVVTEDRPDGPVLAAHWSWLERLMPRETVRDLAETWFRALEGLVRRAADRPDPEPTRSSTSGATEGESR